MKKLIAALAVLVVLAGGSVGAYMIVKDKKDEEKRQASEQLDDNVLFSFDSEGITKIEFNCADGQYITEKDDSGKWVLTNRDDFAIDQVYIQLIRTYTSNLTAEICYGRATDENKAMYGLDEPEKIVVSDKDGDHTLYVGKKSPTGDYYYVMTADKPNIYAIEAIYGSALFADRLTLKAKDLLPYDINSMRYVTIKNKGEVTCELSYDLGKKSWSIGDEYSMLTTNQTSITAELNNLIRLEAEEMLDEGLEDLKKYSFDDPDGEIIVEGLDDSKWSFKVKVMEENPNYCYVLMGNDNQVEIYYTADLDFINMSAYDFIIQKVSGADMFDVSGVDLTIGDTKISADINVSDRECSVDGKKIYIDSTENYTDFQNFYDSFTVLPVSGVDTDVSPKLEDPLLSAVYHLTEGGETKFDVVQDKDRYYIFKDGKYTGAYTDEARFSGRTSVNEFYEKFVAHAE